MNFSEMPYTHRAVEKETGETITVKYNQKTKEYMSDPMTRLNTDYWKLTAINTLFDNALDGKNDLTDSVIGELHKTSLINQYSFIDEISKRAREGDVFANQMYFTIIREHGTTIENLAYQAVLLLLDTKNELQKELLNLKMHSTTRVIL